MTQKPNEPLRLYIFKYTKIHKSVTNRDACYDTDPSRVFRFLTSITNAIIGFRRRGGNADKSSEVSLYLRISSNVLREPLDWKLASNYPQQLL